MVSHRRKRVYTESELMAMDIDDLDEMAFGYRSGQIATLDHKQIKIVWESDIENALWKLEQGGRGWASSVCFEEPVVIKINDQGEFTLDDGHHRFVASRELGIPLFCEITISGNPVVHILRKQAAKKTLESVSPTL